MKTKIGTEAEVGHVTRDTTYKVKGQLAGGGAYCGGLPHSLFSLKSTSERVFCDCLSLREQVTGKNCL